MRPPRIRSVKMTAPLVRRIECKKLDLENECRVRRNSWTPAGPVGEARRNDELALFADFHSGDTLIPPLDDLALAEREIEGSIAIARAVELLAVFERARVVHTNLVPRLGGWSFALG